MTLHQLVVYTSIWLGTLLVSLAAVVMVLLWLPSDYFTLSRGPFLVGMNPLVRITLFVLKNLAGVVVIALGLVMSLPGVPGQGILTILLGLLLVNFPGKFRLERAIIRRPAIHEFVNRLRRRHGRPPLIVP